ncbi:MAG: pyruvate formate lyase family protein, partial [bacterium]
SLRYNSAMQLFNLPSNDLAILGRLKEAIFAGDNGACFIERALILQRLTAENVSSTVALSILLREVSTPVEEDDVFLGRVVEGRWPVSGSRPVVNYPVLNSNGHMTLDWATLLTDGLQGVVRQAQATAVRLGTAEASRFAEDAAQCVNAVEAYARRYAQEANARAEQCTDPQVRTCLQRAAAALAQVPHGPAPDLFSALQSIWLVHLITSCYIGSRDFGLGRMDQYLWPLYQQDLAAGRLTPDEAGTLFAHFCLKTNEITGTTTHNFQTKPIPSVASKQYLMLGGRDAQGASTFNELTRLILEGAMHVRMPEPVLSFRLDTQQPDEVFQLVADSIQALQSQVHVFNDAVIIPALEHAGVPREDAAEYTMIGCCRADIGGSMDDAEMLSYQYHDITHWLLAALSGGHHPVTGELWVEGVCAPEAIITFDEVLAQLGTVTAQRITSAVTAGTEKLSRTLQENTDFRFESLLLRDCVERGRGYRSGGVRYRPQGHFFGGIATVANSLLTIKRLVFDEHRFTLPALLAIVRNNYVGEEALRQEICTKLPKFGNDVSEVDALAAQVGTLVLDALEAVQVPPEQILLSGFYSLDQHHAWGRVLPATPDGRLAGEPVNENQSPVYGTDTHGVTAVLNSVARLPLQRTVMGGLNIKFGGTIASAQLAALLKTYFSLGGIHLGTTFVNRDTLVAAQADPARYRTLCVCMYGFSEYFIALSATEQQELIALTEHS